MDINQPKVVKSVVFLFPISKTKVLHRLYFSILTKNFYLYFVFGAMIVPFKSTPGEFHSCKSDAFPLK